MSGKSSIPVFVVDAFTSEPFGKQNHFPIKFKIK